MKKYNYHLMALTIVFIISFSYPVLASDGWRSGQTFIVTITNITKGQILSPPVILVHNPNFKLFELGDIADESLYTLAEDGQTTLLDEYAANNDDVYFHKVSPGPVFPGESIDIEIESRGRYRFISVAGMLVSSNDAFFAVRNLPLNNYKNSRAYGIAYDAGSEVNSESCGDIPGPPCGNGGVRNTDGAEGFIHVHNGINGIGDIDPTVYDWRNPVAEITVSR